MIKITKLHPSTICAGLAAFSAACLGFALIGQYGFNLHPCELCIMQRFPFGIVIGLGSIGFFVTKAARPMAALSALALLVNSGIAAFHSGVERKWWEGLQGCSTPDMSGSIEDLLTRIQNTAVTRCDEIPWSLFGLSMANYNVLICLAVGMATALYLYTTRKQA